MTVTKRQREQKKRDRQQAKLERRALRKSEPTTEQPADDSVTQDNSNT